jgi:hypothetical protein
MAILSRLENLNEGSTAFLRKSFAIGNRFSGRNEAGIQIRDSVASESVAKIGEEHYAAVCITAARSHPEQNPLQPASRLALGGLHEGNNRGKARKHIEPAGHG